MMITQKTTYVCLLSEYTVASAQAVRHLQPSRVIAISSDFVSRKGAETRFRHLIESWGIDLEVVGSESEKLFPAESYNDSRWWLAIHLLPLLERERNAGFRLSANLTGSTKAAVIALKEVWDWSELHYTAEGARNKLEIFSGDTVNLPPLDLLDEAGLLLDNLKISPPRWSDISSDLLAPAAERILGDYSLGRDRSVIHQHDELLRSLWFPNAGSKNTLARNRVSIENETVTLPPGPLAAFFFEVGDLGHEGLGSTATGGWRLPVDNRHPWARFVSGGWWEFLLGEWIQELGCAYRMHVVIPRVGASTFDAQTADDAEADVLVHSRTSELRVIECKVEPPAAIGLAGMAKTLNELAGQFGKTKRAFALAPCFDWNVKHQSVDDFRAACGLRKIELLKSREALAAWLGSNQ